MRITNVFYRCNTEIRSYLEFENNLFAYDLEHQKYAKVFIYVGIFVAYSVPKGEKYDLSSPTSIYLFTIAKEASFTTESLSNFHCTHLSSDC